MADYRWLISCRPAQTRWFLRVVARADPGGRIKLIGTDRAVRRYAKYARRVGLVVVDDNT